MRDAYIAGAAMTRFGKFPDRTVRALAQNAGGVLGDDNAAAVVTILST